MRAQPLVRIGLAPVHGAARPASPGRPPPVVARAGYIAVLRAAGALPIVLAATEPGLADDYLDLVDGLLLPGGGDLPPRLFGEEPVAGYVAMDDAISDLHVALARRAHERGIPTLGICLGCQVMNVALGGGIIQDLAESPGHEIHCADDDADREHPVTIAAGSRTARALGTERLVVRSRHHQAVSRLGDDLVAVATAPDSVVEALEDPRLPFFIGVQWHPERQPDEAASTRLFQSFVAAALGLD